MAEYDPAKKYFDPKVSDRERAIFEGGIALGALYHQFVGAPVSSDENVIQALQSAMESSIAVQPYRESVKVRIDKNTFTNQSPEPYRYQTLKGRHLTVDITIKYGCARVTVVMRHVPELNYNLMFIKHITDE